MSLNPIISAAGYIVAQPISTPNGRIYPLISDTLEKLHEFALHELRLSPESFCPSETAGFPCYRMPVSRQAEAIALGAAPLALFSDSTQLKTLKLIQEITTFPDRGYSHGRGIADRELAAERKQFQAAANAKAQRIRAVSAG